MKGSEYAPGQIPIVIDGEVLAPDRTVFGLFPSLDGELETVCIFTDPDDPRWQVALAEARDRAPRKRRRRRLSG